ncbi:MAG: inosine/xanthosine triphosphatase [Candidatus Verstraetearchaeota archaeon]|nr:inosine/xanthosine triphosphatase [Candidatus Verstraetearchaeota archaeon]
MIVAVGSSNPVKAQAVKNVFSLFLPRVEVIIKEVSSIVPPQPMGIDETIRGAIGRAKRALEQEESAEMGVGIEAGLSPVPYSLSGWMDQQYAAIADRHGRVTIGGGPSFEYPAEVVLRVLSTKSEVGKVMDELTGIEGLGRRQGAIGYFSKGALDRVRLSEIAVLMAMIPRLNEEMYFIETKQKRPLG